MKLAALLNKSKLTQDSMKNIKGGTTSVVIETMVEVTRVTSSGTTDMLFCDRRRKKVNC